VFVRRGDYCFREERDGQSEKRRGTEIENRRKAKGRGERQRNEGKGIRA